jgi:hypothetical protein
MAEFTAEMRHATLQKANLFGVNFSKADLSFADLRYSDMNSANINGTLFHHAKFEGSITASGRPYQKKTPNNSAKRKWWEVWKPVA